MIKSELLRVMKTSYQYYFNLAENHSTRKVKTWLEAFFFLKGEDGKVDNVKLEDNVLTITVFIEDCLITWEIKKIVYSHRKSKVWGTDRFRYSLKKREIDLGKIS